VLVACVTLVSCGGYRHHQQVAHIVAVNWTPDGRPVRLLQNLTAKWEFHGIAPDVVDPAYDLDGLSVAVGEDAPSGVDGFDGWWRVVWVVARRRTHDFVLQLTRGAEPPERRCVVVPLGQPAEPCSERESSASRPSVSPTDPCDTSYSAIAPDERTWVVACRLQRQSGLWLMDFQQAPRLLLAAPTPLSFPERPDSTPAAEAVNGIEDRMRPFEQTFGLAWSPDGRRVYYCGNFGTKALVVNVADTSSRQVEPCLIGAVWSDDGTRVAGVDADGALKVVDLVGNGP